MRVRNSEPMLNLLDKAENIHILVSPLAGEEALVSGLALKAILAQKANITVIYPGELREQVKKLSGGDQVKRDLPSRDLVISFDVSGCPIERVSYYLEDKNFNLVIKSQRGSLDSRKVTFRTNPFRSDLIIILGCRRLSDLGDLYEKNSSDLVKLPLVNIDYHQDNQQFGQVNIVDERAAGVSEIVFTHLGLLGLRPNYEAAECLLFGLGLSQDLGKKELATPPREISSEEVVRPLEPTDEPQLGPPKIYTGTGDFS